MDKITVAELAAECSVDSKIILAESKRLGLYVFSSTATIDASFADTIRKKILSQKEAEEAKKTAAAVEKKTKKAGTQKSQKTPAVGAQAAAAKKKDETEAEKPKKVNLAVRVRKKAVKPEELPTETVADEIVEDFRPGDVDTAATETAPETKALESQPVAQETAAPVAATELPPQEDAASTPATPAGQKVPAEEAQKTKPAETAGDKKTTTIVVPKKKAATVLIRTTTEAVAPAPPPRVVKDMQKPIAVRPSWPARPGTPYGGSKFIRKQKGGKPEQPVRGPKMDFPRPPANPEDYKPIEITEGVTIKELAEKMGIRSKFIIQKLMSKGILASINQVLDIEAASGACAEFGFRAMVISFEQEAEAKQEMPDNPEDYATRPPVVTIMGHVDHGKTSLLDTIRKTNVAAAEHGGITQHIGAYQVEIPVEGRDRSIVFLDTPGHEAFTMMRARGAQATDIVVLVVAADDGVMPQTVEAIHHSKAANVPIIVAINKIDKPGAQVDRVKQALADQGLLAEDWGGDTVMVEVSAKQMLNIPLLLEMIVLVADMRDMKANPKRLAAGVVLEAKVDRGRGCVATVLVQNGTLRQSDSFVAGSIHGRVRALVNDRGQTIEFAGPSIPVEILGLQDLPRAGDIFQVFEDATKARQVAEFRRSREREAALQKTSRLTLQELYDQMREGTVKELPLIVKADVQGSVEVVNEMLNKLSTEKVKVKILHSGAGAVTETDVLLASASNAIVIGFNVRPERKAQELADTEGVEIRLYTVIYNLTNEIKSAMIGMLEKTSHEKYMGRAEVRDTFRTPKFGVIAGSYVQDGLIKRNSEARLLRDNAVIHEGKISSLRRFKDDVTEVKSGFECGIGFEHFSDIKVGDVIEAYIIEKIQPTTL
ncbi:MAG: translation initiation factor IF-2 [Acidobacteriota bacterium]|jgi:translation initiation factor IF-2|nr:translation initiation factor IF-2 [Acidobacteriota bacterium]